MNWTPIINTIVPPLALAFSAVLVSYLTWLAELLRKRATLAVATKKLDAYTKVYGTAVVYADQAKADPYQPDVKTGPDAQKAALEMARVLLELANLPEPSWDARRMLSDAEVGKLNKGITGGPTLHAQNVTITTSQPPPAVTP